jgi:hypothetical protein
LAHACSASSFVAELHCPSTAFFPHTTNAAESGAHAPLSEDFHESTISLGVAAISATYMYKPLVVEPTVVPTSQYDVFQYKKYSSVPAIIL